MNKITRNIPTILFFYAGILGIFGTIQYFFHRSFGEVYLSILGIGIYGCDDAVFCDEAWLVPYLPVLVMIIILVITSLYFIKNKETSLKLRKISIKFFIIVVAIGISSILLLGLYSKVQMSIMAKEFSKKHLLNTEMVSTLDEIRLSLDNGKI